MRTGLRFVFLSLVVMPASHPVLAGSTTFRMAPEPRWHLGWLEGVVPGSILISGDPNGAWIVDLETNVLLRLGRELTVVETTPLPAALRSKPASPPRTLHVAGFGAGGAWMLDVDARAAWRYSGKTWLGPITVGGAFARGAALSAGSVVLNTPSAGSPFALLDASGRIVARSGRRTEAPLQALAGDYANWIVAAREGEWTAGHQFLPVVERYRSDGTLVWRAEVSTPAVLALEEDRLREIGRVRARVETSRANEVDVKLFHFAEALQYLADGSVVANFSASPALVRLDAEGGAPETYALEGIGSQRPGEPVAVDRFGFAVVADWVLAPVHGVLRAFSRDTRAGRTGRVTDTTGAPIAGARVLIDARQGDPRLSITDEAGVFVFEMLDGDTAITAVASAPDFLDSRFFGRAGDLSGEPLVLERRPEVCVEVVDGKSGDPIGDFEVELRRREIAGAGTGVGMTFATGPRREVHGETDPVCLAAPWKGPFEARVSAAGYAVAFKRVESSGFVRVELQEEARLEVVVREQDGTSLAGGSVLLVEPGALDRNAWKESFRAMTDAGGIARLTQIESGEWDVALLLKADEGVQARRRVRLEPGDNEIELTLEEGTDVRVTLFGPEDSPPAETLVQLQPTGSVGHTGRECRTDGTGRCEMARVKPGRYLAVAAIPGERVVREPITIEAGAGWQEVRLDLGGGETVTGQLLGMELYPDTAFAIYAHAENFMVPDTDVDAGGRFMLHGVKTGVRARILVEGIDRPSSRMWTITETSAVVPNSDEILTIRLPPPMEARGSVHRGQRPCAACLMEWGTGSGAQPRAIVSTSVGGEYRALLGAPGLYQVVITDDQGNSHIRSVDLVEDVTVNFDLGEGRIHGVVIAADSREPLAAATVRLLDGSGQNIGMRVTGGDGGFRFGGLMTGPHRLVADAGARAGETHVTVAGSEAIEVTLEAEAARSVEVYLRDAGTGQPIRRCTARVYDTALAMVAGSMGASLPDDGRLVLPVPGDGPFTAVVWAAGFGVVTIAGLTPESPPRVVAMRPGSSLLLEGSPEAGGTFELLTPEGQAVALNQNSPPGPIPFIGPTMLLRDIPAGPYRARYDGLGGKAPRHWDLSLDAASQSVLSLDRP